MELTMARVLAARRAVTELAEQTLPFRLARRVQQLAAALEREAQTIFDFEQQLAQRLGGVVHEDGRITFQEPADKQAFLETRGQEFADPYDAQEFAPIDLSQAAEGLSISAAALAALEGFVVFDED